MPQYKHVITHRVSPVTNLMSGFTGTPCSFFFGVMVNTASIFAAAARSFVIEPGTCSRFISAASYIFFSAPFFNPLFITRSTCTFL